MYRSNKDGRAAKPPGKRVKTGIPRTPSLFATQQAGVVAARTVRTKLRYQYSASVSPGLTNVLQQFILNSAYDPDYTNTGVQPPFFDRLSAMYNKYRVLAAKYKVSLAYGNNTVPVMAVWHNSVATSPSSLQSACCQPDAQTRLVGNGTVGTVKKYVSMAKIFGVEPAEIQTDSDYGAATSATPVQQAFLSIYIGNHAGTTSSTHALHVEITIYTEWSNPVVDNMN